MPLADAAAYPLWLNALLFAAAAAVICLSGTRLTRHVDAIARQTTLDEAFLGMLLLGGITSLPELANVATASAIGNPALAVNNLLGSAAINVLLLAGADAVIGRHAVTGIVARPSTMMMAALCMIVLIAIAFAVVLGDVAVGGVGLGAIAIGTLSVFSFWLSTGIDARSPWHVRGEGDDPTPDAGDGAERSLSSLWTRVALHGAVVFSAGYVLSQTGDALATQAGLTSAIVGFGLVGTATSLPELVTIVVALRLNRPEMAFGQVMGSNFVNLSLLPLAEVIHDGEPVLNTLGRFEAMAALLAAAMIGVFVVGLLEHRDRTIFRMGIDSAAVIALFALGCVALASV